MTGAPPAPQTPDGRIESIRVVVARVGFAAIAMLLAGGVVATLAGAGDMAGRALAAAIGLLTLMPLTGVAALLAEEVRRGDWPFVAAAVVVLGLIAWNLSGLVP